MRKSPTSNPRPICLSAWSPVGRSVLEGLGGVAFVGGVSLERGG